jgi:hypothetical protein
MGKGHFLVHGSVNTSLSHKYISIFKSWMLFTRNLLYAICSAWTFHVLAGLISKQPCKVVVSIFVILRARNQLSGLLNVTSIASSKAACHLKLFLGIKDMKE